MDTSPSEPRERPTYILTEQEQEAFNALLSEIERLTQLINGGIHLIHRQQKLYGLYGLDETRTRLIPKG